MRSRRRGTVIWLAMLGAAVGLVALAAIGGNATISPAVALVLVAVYLGVAIAALADIPLGKLPGMVTPLATAATKTSPAARKASQRARNRPDYNTDAILLDVGMIANEKRRDGQWHRRLAQSVSMDDGFVQPFIKIHVTPEQADRLALVEFELYDQTGKLQFNHRVEQWVRDGENLILSDRQLPVRGNESISRSGMWDLRVRIDGSLAAIHSFTLTPASTERRQTLEEDGEAPLRHDLAVPDEDEGPISLEDLLREQRRDSN